MAPQRRPQRVVTTALDLDPAVPALLGTLVWTLLLLVGLSLQGELRADGRGWWLWTCAAGTLLGLVGMAWAAVLRRRHDRSAATGSSGSGTVSRSTRS